MHGQDELNKKKHLPVGVAELNQMMIRQMKDAMVSAETPVLKMMTPISKVELLFLDTQINVETIKLIVDLGFSRIPVAFSKEKPIIIGILLVKKLLCVTKDGETIKHKIQMNEIALVPPLYLTKEAPLLKVARAFEEGQSHMGIVC